MLAPAETSANENHLQAEFETPIGIIPHQVKLYFRQASDFSIIFMPIGKKNADGKYR